MYTVGEIQLAWLSVVGPSLNGRFWLLVRKSAANIKHSFGLITDDTSVSVKAKLRFDVMTRPCALCRHVIWVLAS